MYTVTKVPERRLLDVHMSGFFSCDEVLAFSRDEQRAVAEMGLASGEFLLLIDTTACVIQSQDVVAAFQRIVTESPLKARRIATVRASSLSRAQSRRITQLRDDAQVFATRAEAEEWLFAVPGAEHATEERCAS